METTLNYVLTYIAYTDKTRTKGSLKPGSFIVLADNDYYSSPTEEPDHPSTTQQQQQPQQASGARFRHYNTSLRAAHKTGLGSSAAIVTALTAALLAHYLDPLTFDVTSAEGRRVLHNLAQLAHCAAQGKVGSGFDVATAVYGSSVYRRFSPSLIPAVAPGEPNFATLVTHTVNQGDWDCQVHPELVGLPPGVAIRMCDVDCGTQTVSMVKKVHEWRDRNPDDAARAYEELQGCVDRLAEVLRESKTEEIGAAMRPVRDLMRKMGQDSGAPIEPESQETMLHALEKVPGVYGTVVPGAGGYDAAAMVMKDDEETERRVNEFLEGWSRDHGIRVRLMGVKGETEGVRTEDAQEFVGWLQ